MPTDSYVYLPRQLEEFMMTIFHGLVISQNMSTQKMSNLRGSLRTQNTSTQNMSNSHGCSTDKSTPKRVNINRRESKRVNVNACYTDIIKLKSVNKVDTSKVKYKRDEEPLVTDNSKIEVIKAPGYFKLSECSKKFFNNLDATYKLACM